MSSTTRNGLGNFKSVAQLPSSLAANNPKMDFSSPYSNNQGSSSVLEKDRSDPAMVRRLNQMQMHRSLDPAKIEPSLANSIDVLQKRQENTIMTMLSNNLKFKNQQPIKIQENEHLRASTSYDSRGGHSNIIKKPVLSVRESYSDVKNLA